VDLPSSQPSENNEETEDVFNRTLLAVALLGVYARQALESSPISDEPLTSLQLLCVPEMAATSYLSQIVELFESVAIRQITEMTSVTRNRWFKLLSMMALHRTVFVALKENIWVGKKVELQVAASILSKCIGPFAFGLIKKEEDESRVYQLYDTTVECYIRPLAALEKLLEYHDQDDEDCYDDLLDQSSGIMNSLFQILTAANHLPPPIPCIEKSAKVSPAVFFSLGSMVVNV
jgi:hypothetical protein